MNRPMDPGSSPRRIVSLLPSMTDSLFALGLGNHLVGATDWCPLPESAAAVKRVGEPGKLRIAEIVNLKPELVLAGGEDNQQVQIDALTGAGLRVWTTCPRTVRQAVSDLRDLVLSYASVSMLQSVVWLDRFVDWLEGAKPEKRLRVFCPRSREGSAEDPSGWVTVNDETYAGDLLSLCGAENVFASRKEDRYPKVTPEEVAAADPEMILMPDSPFPFQEEDASYFTRKMPALRAVQARRIRSVDGRLVFWPGTRLGESIHILPEWFRSSGP